MDSSASRFVAALLSQTPGSEATQSAGGTTIAMALVPVKHVVVVLEASDHPIQMKEQIKQAVDTAKLGVPLHVVLINPRDIDVSDALKENISLVQVKAVTGWNWVPGKDAVCVRGPTLAQVVSAAKLANSSASLSFEEVTQASHREADAVREFQAAVMMRKPVVSWALAAACVATFALQMFWGGGEPVIAAASMGALIPTRVVEGEWWRLFAVMLLHANFVHLLMNMMAMLSFGPFLERLMGSGRYLSLFVLSGLGGSLLSLTRGGEGIGVGASGGVWGLMVAGAVAVTWPRGLLPSSLATQMRQRAWVPVGINLMYSLQPGIDMRAHLGGGIAGALLVLVLTRGAVPNEPLKPSRVFNFAAVGVALVLAASMGISVMQGKPWMLNGPWTLARVTLEGTGVSLTVPQSMTLRHEADSALWHFGELNSTGAEFIVQVSPAQERAFDIPPALEEMVESAGKETNEGLHYTQVPKLVKLPSGREVVKAEMAPDNKDDTRYLHQWWSTDGHRWVLVLANALNSTSPERHQQLEQIADSVLTERLPDEEL